MSEERDFDISQYWNNSVLFMENLHIVDRRIAALQKKWRKESLKMKNCSLENVVFDNHCGRGIVEIIDSEFTNCVFHDTLGNGKLDVEKSIFINCIFENICLNGACDFSEISQSKFINCKFRNIDIKWKTTLFDLELNGGGINQLSLVGQRNITRVQITNMRIEGIKMWEKNFYENKIEDAILRDVVLTGSKHEIILTDCDVKGLTFADGTLGLESL